MNSLDEAQSIALKKDRYREKDLIERMAQEIIRIDFHGFHGWDQLSPYSRVRAIHQAKKCLQLAKEFYGVA